MIVISVKKALDCDELVISTSKVGSRNFPIACESSTNC